MSFVCAHNKKNDEIERAQIVYHSVEKHDTITFMPQEETQEIRSNMAEFKGHLESYDSQLSEVKRNVGDTRHEVTQMKDLVLLLQRNVSELRRNLQTLQGSSKEMNENLDLLSDVRRLYVLYQFRKT